MKKLYLYIRLSDADDDLKFKTESESIANQRTLLYRFVQALIDIAHKNIHPCTGCVACG